MRRSRLLSAFCYCLVTAGYLEQGTSTVSCTGLHHLILITIQFQRQCQETVSERSLVIFTFKITLIWAMIVITKSDPYLTFWIEISKDLYLRITLVSIKVWYHINHIVVDMVRSSLLEESPFGYKLWCLCSSYGYLLRVEPYCKKITICQKQD